MILLLLCCFLLFAVEKPADIGTVLNSTDFNQRFAEAVESLGSLPDDQTKHFIFIVDISGSMVNVCGLISQAISIVLEHMGHIEGMVFSVQLFGEPFAVLFDHVNADDAKAILASHKWKCNTATPMKTAFNKARKLIRPGEFTVGMLITDGQSTETIKDTRKAAEEFKTALGKLGEDTLGLYALGLGDAAQAELLAMSSSYLHYHLFSEIGVLIRVFKSSFEAMELKRMERNSVVTVDLTEVRTGLVDHTGQSVPIYINFSVVDSPDGYVAPEYLKIDLHELSSLSDEKKPFFNHKKGVKAKRVSEAGADLPRYRYVGELDPREPTKHRNALKVPYELEIKATEPNIVFEKNTIKFSVSTYTKYFDISMNVLPLGAGEVGKSLWVFTNHVSHSLKMNWEEVQDVVEFGSSKKFRTMDISLFKMSDVEERYIGTPHAYFDIFGLSVYVTEFLKPLFKGWIPKGFKNTQYANKEYLSITGPPEDPNLKLPPVDCVGFLFNGEALLQEEKVEMGKKNLMNIQEADPSMPIVIIISCHDTYQCDQTVLDSAREKFSEVCENCPINDLNPYIVPDKTGLERTEMLKSSRIDKNQVSIDQDMEMVVKRRRKNKAEKFCTSGREERILCDFKRKQGMKGGLTEEEDRLGIKIEYKIDSMILECTYDLDGCRDEMDLFYCEENEEICKYPDWLVLVDNPKKFAGLYNPLETERKVREREVFTRSCWQDPKKDCQNMYELYTNTRKYCNRDSIMVDMCLFLESDDSIEFKSEYETMDHPTKCYVHQLRHSDFCLEWYEAYEIRKRCLDSSSPQFHLCKCMFDGPPTEEDIINHVVADNDNNSRHSKMMDILYFPSKPEHEEWMESCKNDVVDEFCADENNERVCECVDLYPRKFGEDGKFRCAVGIMDDCEKICDEIPKISGGSVVRIFLSLVLGGLVCAVSLWYFFGPGKGGEVIDDVPVSSGEQEQQQQQEEDDDEEGGEGDDDKKKKKKKKVDEVVETQKDEETPKEEKEEVKENEEEEGEEEEKEKKV